MSAETAAPCRHPGAPPQSVVDRVARVLEGLGGEAALLARHGLTAEEYAGALPAAIEAVRGSRAASNSDRRRFLESFFEAMLTAGLIERLQIPVYGDDTVYRLTIRDVGDVAVIQKGCPDGAHSSVRWAAPEWATETYLWWLCSSLASEPGEHVVKGVNRLRKRFFSEAPDTVDGVIFHNELCGGPQRPCPKAGAAAQVGGRATPPPCIYVMPDRQAGGSDWNWEGRQQRVFPTVLLKMFGIDSAASAAYIGHVGFRQRGATTRTTTESRFGPGRLTLHRN